MIVDNQTLILVDGKDNFLGYASRKDCHRGLGKHHRAFVTLLFDSEGRILLQKRKHKLFNGLWDFTAISHPQNFDGKDENYQVASDRALAKEMGIRHVPIKKIGGFNYFAKDGKNCENEYCAVLIGNYDGNYKPNKDEVYNTRKVDFGEFLEDIRKNSKKYTPWTILGVEKVEEYKKLAGEREVIYNQ